MKVSKNWKGDKYECKYQWPEDCYVQHGGNGIVFQKGTLQESLNDPLKGLDNIVRAKTKQPDAPKHYITAFFEAFPNNPDTFIRGEGDTVEQAEQNAWDKYQKYLVCNGHEFERRGYRNGAGFCKHCNLFKSSQFEPLEKCVICDANTYYSSDNKGNWYCEEHNKENPDSMEVKFPELFLNA